MYRIVAIFLLYCSVANALVAIENNRVRFSFHDDGFLSGIRDLQSGKELLPPKCRGQLFSLRLRGDDNKPRDVSFKRFHLLGTEKKGYTVYFQFIGAGISVNVSTVSRLVTVLKEGSIRIKCRRHQSSLHS